MNTKTKRAILFRRKKKIPLTRKRIFEISEQYKGMYICLDETVWDEDMHTGNNSWM